MTRLLVVLVALSWGALADAAPTPWAFDFDPALAEDPAYITARLQELQQGLPGLPPDAGIVEVITDGPVALYFFDDIADMLFRARDSGPGIVPPVSRPAEICVEHAGFTAPDLLATGGALCEAAEQAVLAAYEPSKLRICAYVEYPESYVYDHAPIGFVDTAMVTNWSTLISLIGEALTYVDYPEGLLPADFYDTLRNILSKLRYDELKTALANQMGAYDDAVGQLQANPGCFDSTRASELIATTIELSDELAAVEEQLDAIYADGVAEATADRIRVENQGRLRQTLPYPALTDRDRELLATFIGGLCWRIRGSGLLNVPDDETSSGLLRRIYYVQHPYALIAKLTGGDTDAAGVGFQIFIDENWGYAEWYDMGTDPGSRDKYADLVEMTNRGKRATSTVAPTIAGRGYDIRALVAGGLQMGLCYYYVWEELNYLEGGQVYGFLLGEDLDDKTQYPEHVMRFLECPTATGEFCTGAALALGLVRTFLWGKEGGTVCTPSCAGKPCGADDGCGLPCTEACGDGGVPPLPDDAGSVPPGGSDAGTTPPGSSDAGTTGGNDSTGGGCGCRAAGHHEPRGGALILAVVLAAMRRRRTRASAALDCLPRGAVDRGVA